MDATTMAVDLAKDVFEVALANRAHGIIDRKRLTRRQFESLIDGVSPGTRTIQSGAGRNPAPVGKNVTKKVACAYSTDGHELANQGSRPSFESRWFRRNGTTPTRPDTVLQCEVLRAKLAQPCRSSLSTRDIRMLGTEVLRSVPLLSALSDAEIGLVARSSRRLQFPKKSIVFQEGDPGDFLLITLRGRVKVMLLGEGGQETIVAVLEPPAFLGEVALLDDGPRSATVMTLEKTEFLQITRAHFLALVRERPPIAMKVIAHLASELRHANEQIRSLSMFDAYGRIIRCLLGIAREHGSAEGNRLVIRPKPSFQELAQMIGCSRETVSRAIKTLQQTGYVSVIDRGLALEQRAIRRYVEPSLQNLSAGLEQASSGSRRR